MRHKKKTTIVTFESRERMTIRQGGSSLLAWCEGCGVDVLMVTPHEAAVRAGLEAGTIFRAVESGTVHFVEDEHRTLLVCMNSVDAL